MEIEIEIGKLYKSKNGTKVVRALTEAVRFPDSGSMFRAETVKSNWSKKIGSEGTFYVKDFEPYAE